MFFYRLLFSHHHAFDEIYVTIFYMCIQNWIRREEKKENIDAFMEEMKNLVLQAINISKPITILKFQQSTLIDETEKLEEDVVSVERTLNTPLERVIDEIFTTEKAYLEDLNTVVTVFIIPLQIKSVLSKEQIDILFGKIETLIPISLQIVKAWDDRAKPESTVDELCEIIGDIFLEIGNFLNYMQIIVHNIQILLLKRRN